MGRPFRPPSVPLVTVDPYFSVWSPCDHLYDGHTVHWTNQRQSMVGLIRIDGKTKRFIGKINMENEGGYEEPASLKQTGLKVEPLSTTYIFDGEGIELEVNFTTPLLLNDLDLLSRPLSYLTFKVRSTDGHPHNISLYFDISGEWCVNTTDQAVVWEQININEQVLAMRMGSEEQPVLKRAGDDTRIDWGYCYLVVPNSPHVSTVIHSYHGRKMFADTGRLTVKMDDRKPRAVLDDTPVMTAMFNIELTHDNPQSSNYLILAYDDILSIEYFGKPLNAYWRRTGLSFNEMISRGISEYHDVMQKCADFNARLIQESVAAGGEKYKDLLSLAYRQAIAAHKLVVNDNGDLLFFSKENFSNGCIATVDVSYPSIPLFLRYNLDLVKGMMRPILQFAKSGEWLFDFAPHDVGCYPKANGQVYGENKLEYQMPIEECGNMLIMAAAVCQIKKDPQFAEESWSLLTRWANYLMEHGMDPENQLCTDDFAGHLAHNANLSIKAILGIGAYARLCQITGKSNGDDYLKAAKEMALKWVEMADAGNHYKLTFDGASETWSQKYNLVWDRLLDLHLFPEEVFGKEIEFYLMKQNQYGLPLDNRNTYTKADWLVWSASLAKTKEIFEQMITPLWDFLNETPSRVPFTDWYDTVTGKQMNFQNRSVVGGLFIKLLSH
ncbi:glutaminase domain-containing protein [Camelliibacillus cellulosilyticus]|uniref:Glutaminase domain-containing protein n=1 Tax=Camelliibacillus cellulosilyticus TaxID=2174486 RepID=A0ABV9GNJ9_9BACL